MESIPAILDVRDDLERARTATDRDIRGDVDRILDRLEEFAERDRAGREGILDEIDNELLRLEELVSGEPARRIRAARNRIRIYRESLARSSENLTIVDVEIRTNGGAVDVEEDVVPMDPDEDVVVRTTVVNDGEPRRVRLVVKFYDGDGSEIDEVTNESVFVDAHEQTTIDATTTVPGEAERYTVAAVDEGSIPGA